MLENDIFEECASSPDAQALKHLREEMGLTKPLTPKHGLCVSVVGLTGKDDEIFEGVVHGVSIKVMNHLPRQERTPQRGGHQFAVRQS